MPTNRDSYVEAVHEAEATYGLVSAETPIFVRWVLDPQEVQDGFWRSGIGFLVAECSVYLLVSLIFGPAMQRSSKRSESPTLEITSSVDGPGSFPARCGEEATRDSRPPPSEGSGWGSVHGGTPLRGYFAAAPHAHTAPVVKRSGTAMMFPRSLRWM